MAKRMYGRMSRQPLPRSPSLRQPSPRPGSLKLLGVAAFVAVMCACEKPAHEHLVDARSSLGSAAYADAITAADAGLSGSPSEQNTWGLELVKLEAYARGGDGEAAKEQLSKLAGKYPNQISATDYSGTAQQLQATGQGPPAIEVLDQGKQRYPDDELIGRMIAESIEVRNDPAELEMLRSLGYIE